MNGTSQVGGSLTRGGQYGPQGLRAVNAGRQQVRSACRQLMAGASGGCLIWPHWTASESMWQDCPLPYRWGRVSPVWVWPTGCRGLVSSAMPVDRGKLADVCPFLGLLMCLRACRVDRGLRSSSALQELADMSTFNPAYGSRTPTYGSGPDSPASINTTQPLNGPGMDSTIDGHLVVSQPVILLRRGQSTALH